MIAFHGGVQRHPFFMPKNTLYLVKPMTLYLVKGATLYLVCLFSPCGKPTAEIAPIGV